MYDIIGERTNKDKGNNARPLCIRCAVRFFVRVHRSDAGGLAARQGKFVYYDGKYASRWRAKALAGGCAVLP